MIDSAVNTGLVSHKGGGVLINGRIDTFDGSDLVFA